MNWITPIKAVPLYAACVAILIGGCESPPEIVRKEPQIEGKADLIQKEELQAIASAKEEVVRRGWKEFEVHDIRFYRGHWLVYISKLPITWGRDAMGEVARDGKVIGFLPGK